MTPNPLTDPETVDRMVSNGVPVELIEIVKLYCQTTRSGPEDGVNFLPDLCREVIDPPHKYPNRQKAA